MISTTEFAAEAVLDSGFAQEARPGMTAVGGVLPPRHAVPCQHFAHRLLVGALDDDAGAAAAVGVFHLRAEFSGAEIKLGADAGLAQGRRHALIVGDAVLVEHGDDDGPGLRSGLDLAEMSEGSLEPGYADGEAGCGYRLSAE